MRAIIIAALILFALPAHADVRGFSCAEVRANVKEARKFLTEKQLADLQRQTLTRAERRAVAACLKGK